MSTVENPEFERILEDHERRIARLEKHFKSQAITIGKTVSMREFMLEKRPRNDAEKTLVVGCYIEKHKGLPSFSVKDLENGFREARERVPGNISREIAKNIQDGHMMEFGEERDNLKAWDLTNSGERFVDTELGKD